MSDQGDAGRWRPASHIGPYSEPDEPTGPLPAVGGGDPASPAFPPVSAPSGDRRAAGHDALTGGFPGEPAAQEAAFPGSRERAPFEPADPPSGLPAPAAEPTGASAEAEPPVPGAPSPAGTAGPAFGGTSQFSFPPPGPDDEGIGADPAPPAGAPGFAADGPRYGSPADGAGPSPGSDTAAGPEKPYGFETSPGAGPSAEAGFERTADVRPPVTEEDAPPSWASTPGAWSDPSSSGEPAVAWPSVPGEPATPAPSAPEPRPAAPSASDAWSEPAAPGTWDETPAFGSGTWSDASSPAPEAAAAPFRSEDRAEPPAPEARPASPAPAGWSDDPGLGPAAWGEAPAGPDASGDTPAPGPDASTATPAFGSAADAPAFGADAWGAAAHDDGPAYGSGKDIETPAYGAGEDTDAPAFGSGTDTPAFGADAWGAASASVPDARPGSSDSPEAWGDPPSPSPGGWRADSEPEPATWGDAASGSDAHRDAPAFGSDAGADTPAFGTGKDIDTPAFGAGAWDEPSSSAADTWTDTPAPSSSGRHRAGPPDSSPPPGGDIPPVDPYDARDAGHGYEVSDPSFGLGLPSGSPGRRAAAEDGVATGGEVPDVSSAWETPAYEGAYEDRSAQAGGFAGGPGGGASLDETPPPRPYGAPGDPFPGEPADGAGGAHRGPAVDHDRDHEFFGAGDDPANWGSVGPSGPPPQPGKPSSGNLRLPEWMREESGGAAAPAAGGDDSAGYDYDYGYDEDGKSRLPLIAGLGVLVAGLLVAAGVYFLKGGGDDQQRPAAHVTTAPGRPDGATVPNGGGSAAQQPQKALPAFNGPHTASVGRIVDQRAGLSYPKLGRPWQPQPKNGQMTELGFSEGQYALGQKAGQAKVWARLMSGPLGGADKGAYQGDATVQAAATQVAATYEKKLYGFRHHRKLIASQPLDVGGLKGWLVGYHLTYHRPATKATGDLYTVAVVDTGKREPGVLLMSVPDTERRLYPDVNFVVQSLEVR